MKIIDATDRDAKRAAKTSFGPEFVMGQIIGDAIIATAIQIGSLTPEARARYEAEWANAGK